MLLPYIGSDLEVESDHEFDDLIQTMEMKNGLKAKVQPKIEPVVEVNMIYIFHEIDFTKAISQLLPWFHIFFYAK